MRKLQEKVVATMAGISTLIIHDYDEIGLLKLDDVTESGYRLYSDGILNQLQQILFCRPLHILLKAIKAVMNELAYVRLKALRIQRG